MSLALALNVLWAQPFHMSYNTRNINIPAHEWAKKGDNYDCAVVFLVLSTQLVTAGYAGSLGAEHRKNVLKDWALTLTFGVVMALLVVMVIGGPSDFHCIMRTNCDSYTSRNMAVPFIEEFSAGNVGGCFLGPTRGSHGTQNHADYAGVLCSGAPEPPAPKFSSHSRRWHHRVLAICGKSKMPRTEVTKAIWAYIKKNSLNNGRTIKPDAALKAIFPVASLDMLKMASYVSKHLS